MTDRSSIATIACLAFALTLSACGGSGSGGNGGGGGGGGGSGGAPVISQLVPSSIQEGQPLTPIVVYGTHLYHNAQMQVDGVTVNQTYFLPSGVVQGEIPAAMVPVGTHQITISGGSFVSNALPLTVTPPQPGPQVMQAAPGFYDGVENPGSVVAADVNNDGLSDVIVAGTGTDSYNIAILYGHADGNLSAPQYIATSGPVASLAAADVDGDGNVDLVFVENGGFQSTVFTLLGDGHGNFQASSTPQSPPGPPSAAAHVADIDGDGKSDVVMGLGNNDGTYTLVWLRNLGGGNFGSAVALVNGQGGTVSIADFNHDGRPDILYASTDLSFHILLNPGNGQFYDQPATGLFMNSLTAVACVLDFNLDGIPDLAVQSNTQGNGLLYSFAGNGDGSFTQVASFSPGYWPLASGDFDHDGLPDLISEGGPEPSELIYLFGDGRGNFTQKSVVGPSGQFAVVGDFNGDGIADVIVPDRFDFVSLSLGRNHRNFLSPVALFPTTVTTVYAGKITPNGLPDILVGGNSYYSIPGTVFQNLGNGSFQFAANTPPSAFMLADMTGKGVVDLIGSAGLYPEIWPNNGTPNFSSSSVTLSEQAGYISVADMDGDGCADIISATGEILYGNCSYQFTPVPLPNLSDTYVIGDFNGDGKLDIATYTGGTTYLNTGGRTFQEVSGSNLPLIYGALLAVGDFNGDGKDDVAINLPGVSLIAIYYSRGDGTFYQSAELDCGQYPGAVEVADLNGDGRPDLVVGLMLSQQGCLLFNDGNGQFSRSFFASGTDTISMTTSDLNGDGKPDVVLGNFVYDFVPPNVNVVFHK